MMICHTTGGFKGGPERSRLHADSYQAGRALQRTPRGHWPLGFAGATAKDVDRLESMALGNDDQAAMQVFSHALTITLTGRRRWRVRFEPDGRHGP
jgi:hypothetical protein